jgi:threonine dehydrogenase-like Zn-dependent dehydrogenase
MSFVVPNGLSLDIAALTEPMAVALHAVRRSEIGKRDAAVVIGCGPVGLAIICHLKARGVRTIVEGRHHQGPCALRARVGSMEKLRRLHVYRVADALGTAGPKRPVIFECVGVPVIIVFGYTPLEFRDTLYVLAEGKVDAAPMITGTVGLDGVAAAFGVLAGAETHAKILIDPTKRSTGAMTDGR